MPAAGGGVGPFQIKAEKHAGKQHRQAGEGGEPQGEDGGIGQQRHQQAGHGQTEHEHPPH